MIGKVSVESRESFVVIEAVGNSPRIQGEFDTFLCRWRDVTHFVQDYLDAIDEEEKATLSFTCHRWTQQELDAYCEENGIDSTIFGD